MIEGRTLVWMTYDLNLNIMLLRWLIPKNPVLLSYFSIDLWTFLRMVWRGNRNGKIVINQWMFLSKERAWKCTKAQKPLKQGHNTVGGILAFEPDLIYCHSQNFKMILMLLRLIGLPINWRCCWVVVIGQQMIKYLSGSKPSITCKLEQKKLLKERFIEEIFIQASTLSYHPC